ncbi:MAG: CaiB/BaiF CoA-transferase family protein [Pseudomonadota bacterium]
MLKPLEHVRIVEFCGLGPVPFAGMYLAQLGAEVICVLRPGQTLDPTLAETTLARGKSLIEADLKNPKERAKLLSLIGCSDVVLEGFRPGVMERNALGPDTLLKRHPKLVYGRMTGWGQTGPRASEAGHDINYIALTGALHAIGSERPTPPLNLVGDFGGGAMYLVAGVMAALIHAGRTGQGQVVDAAIVDGAAHLMSMIFGMATAGAWQDHRAANLLDGAAPFYTSYECADGGWLAVGPLEDKFFAVLVAGLGIDPAWVQKRHDPAQWAALTGEMRACFAKKPRAHWLAVFDGQDACVSPVNTFADANADPHLTARGVFEPETGLPTPAPRFAQTPLAESTPEAQHMTLEEACAVWGR